MAVIAVDIGGTKIKAAILNTRHTIVKSIRVPTRAQNGKKYVLDTIVTLIESLSANTKVTGVGFSMPGSVDEKGRLIDVGTRLRCLEGVKIQEYLEKQIKNPIVIENDANCFALAESHLGAGKSARVVFGVIWGSGVGGSVTIKKHNRTELLPFPFEFGHNKFFDQYTNKYVELEKVAGGSFLVKTYKRLGGKLSSPTVSDIYASTEPLAKKLIKQVLEHLGREIANVVNSIKPDVVVLGGGVSQLPDSAYVKLFAHIKRFSLPAHTKKLKLKRFVISNDAGLVGAAILASKLK